jgi:thiol-disulfide isomerase/thioredoxin
MDDLMTHDVDEEPEAVAATSAESEPEEEGFSPFDIDLSFAPLRKPTIEELEIDGELILIDPETVSVHHLDQRAAFLWRCFDGETTLGELSEDIALAVEIPKETADEQVVDLTQWLGVEGLLDGVARVEAVGEEEPDSLQPGEELPAFALPDADKVPVDITDLRGRKVLLVNWSPRCSYCEKVAPELAEVVPALDEQGVELVLVAAASREENLEMLETTGLKARLLLKEFAGYLLPPDSEHIGKMDAGFIGPFPNMGTPVGYLLDEEGKVAEPLAYGAIDVPELARKAAGLPLRMAGSNGSGAAGHEGHDHEDGEDHDHEDGDEVDERLIAGEAAGIKYLPQESSACGPGAASAQKPRVWAGTRAYRIGEYTIGIRADSARTHDIIARMLAEYVLPEGTYAPDDYSVVLAGGGAQVKELNLLVTGPTTLVRSRSERRVLLALAAELAFHLPPENDGLFRTIALAAVRDGEALLIPNELFSEMSSLQSPFGKLGFSFTDDPITTVDIDTMELVVRPPRLNLDMSVMDEVDTSKRRSVEAPMVEPGRYPIRWWIAWVEHDEPMSKAEVITAVLPSIITDPAKLSAAGRTLDRVFDRVPPMAARYSGARDYVRTVADLIAS